MARQMKKRTPVIVLVCEGRNKTERKYFNHFINRGNKYNLIIVDSKSPDIQNMVKKANELYKEYNIILEDNEHVYCLVDLDANEYKYKKFLELKNKNKKIEFIISNPCFEIWLLYHKEKNPKNFLSSQKVKEYMGKYIPNYEESMDAYSVLQLEDKFAIAINNSECKNNMYSDEVAIIDRNPYTEVQDIITLLQELNRKTT